MVIGIRKWKLEDKTALAENLNNVKILDNLRDGLPVRFNKALPVIGKYLRTH